MQFAQNVFHDQLKVQTPYLKPTQCFSGEKISILPYYTPSMKHFTAHILVFAGHYFLYLGYVMLGNTKEQPWPPYCVEGVCSYAPGSCTLMWNRWESAGLGPLFWFVACKINFENPVAYPTHFDDLWCKEREKHESMPLPAAILILDIPILYIPDSTWQEKFLRHTFHDHAEGTVFGDFVAMFLRASPASPQKIEHSSSQSFGTGKFMRLRNLGFSQVASGKDCVPKKFLGQ